ncbi:hypothetical protein PS15p_208690 [Mucor circinelloides]
MLNSLALSWDMTMLLLLIVKKNGICLSNTHSDSSLALLRLRRWRRLSDLSFLCIAIINFLKNNNNDNCMIQELEREFKAVSKRNRTMYNRYDDNGVFSMTCSRHGIPLRLYDIYRGKGRKYALASIEYVLNTREYKQPLSIVYDIACLCQSRLEVSDNCNCSSWTSTLCC